MWFDRVEDEPTVLQCRLRLTRLVARRRARPSFHSHGAALWHGMMTECRSCLHVLDHLGVRSRVIQAPWDRARRSELVGLISRSLRWNFVVGGSGSGLERSEPEALDPAAPPRSVHTLLSSARLMNYTSRGVGSTSDAGLPVSLVSCVDR